MKAIVTLTLTILTMAVFAQFPSSVKKIESKANNSVSVKGNLSEGKVMDDLSWAWSSSIACFPATQKEKFTGNHVLYYTNLPRKSEMTITVIPDDKNANFSIYAYQIGSTNYSVVPSLASCVTCEAEHKWDYKKAGKTQDHTRSVFVNAINNPYNVVIGVVGASGLKTGGYTLVVKIVGGEEADMGPQASIAPVAISCEKNKVTTVKGNLNQGVIMNDLSWAWSSQNACFPETQKKKFTGNHVIYTTDIPKYSEMEITVIPDDKNANFSIYAYETSTTSPSIVPNLPSCVSCEAEHKWDYKKAGKTQDHTRTVYGLTAINNPYKVVIGVVGADGLKTGGYTLQINLKSR